MVPEDHLTGDRARDVAEVADQVDEKVIDCQHPDHPVVRHERETPERMRAGDREGRAHVSVGIQRDDLTRYHRVDPGVRWELPRDATPHNVTIRHDSDEASFVDDHERTDVPRSISSAASFKVASGATVTTFFLVASIAFMLEPVGRLPQRQHYFDEGAALQGGRHTRPPNTQGGLGRFSLVSR